MTDNSEITHIHDHLFHKEVEFLHYARDILSSAPEESIRQEYSKLLDSYSKLLKQSRKLIKMSDLYQKELKEANEEIQDKVMKLTSAQNQLKQLSVTDDLTSLYNRRGAYKHLEAEIEKTRESRKSFMIFLIDIDHFKKINDHYGHHGGDSVLIRVCSVMKESIREMDFLSRWGGEEFLLLLPGTDSSEGKKAAEKIRKSIEETVTLYEGRTIHVTITLGGCLYKPGDNLTRCIEHADRALYSGKALGRNRVELYEN